MNLNEYKRNYRYKGINPGKEQKQFWIAIVIGLIIVAGILYFF